MMIIALRARRFELMLPHYRHLAPALDITAGHESRVQVQVQEYEEDEDDDYSPSGSQVRTYSSSLSSSCTCTNLIILLVAGYEEPGASASAGV